MAPDLLETGTEPRPPSRARRVLVRVFTAVAVGVAVVAAGAQLAGQLVAGQDGAARPAASRPAQEEAAAGDGPGGVSGFRGRGHAFQHGFASGLWTVVVERGRVAAVRAGELTVRLPGAGTRTFTVTETTTVTGSAPGVKSFAVGDRVRVTGERRGTRLVATRVTGLPAPTGPAAAP